MSSSSAWLSQGAAMQQHLQRALAEMEGRQQVQECVHDMITNIEWADYWNQQLQAEQTQQALQRCQQQQAAVAAESALVRRENASKATELGDALVRELCQVSQELGQLYQLRKDHDELSQNYDVLMAKFLQAEERIQFMQEGGDGGGNGEATSGGNEETPATDSPTEEEDTVVAEGAAARTSPAPDVATVPPAQEGVDELTQPDAGTVADVVPETQPPAETVPQSQPATSSSPAESGATNEATQQPQQEEAASSSNNNNNASSSAVVAVVQDDPEEEPPRLETLHTNALMHIFGFLDALDILNTAQVNVSMYSRVDNLFGLGGDATAAGDSSTIATADSNAGAHAVPTEVVPAEPLPQPTAVVPPEEPPRGAEQTPAAPATQPAVVATEASTSAAGTVASLSTSVTGTTATATTSTTAGAPALPMTPQGASATANAAASQQPAGQGFERSLFGFLQPRKTPASPHHGAAAAATAGGPVQTASGLPAPPNPSTTGGTAGGPKNPRASPEPAPMNAAMANSMASKLTDAELQAVMHMADRLKTHSAQLEQFRTERERLLAQLDGTDAVKQFLVAKVRSMEESLRQTEDQQAKVAQQIASDQEVICFLDGRVQELEHSLATAKEETSRVQREWKEHQTQAEQKATVLTDMLRFERERVQEGTAEFKATKKLLIKEVKSCRAQIMALTAENKAMSQENETLKRALLHSGGGGAAPPSSPKFQHHTRVASMS